MKRTPVGGGNQAGGSDAANLLKPAPARGEVKTIAATTWSEYKSTLRKIQLCASFPTGETRRTVLSKQH